MKDKRDRGKKNGSSKAKSHAKGSDKRWSSKVKTVSTFPPKDTFNKDAESIAKTMPLGSVGFEREANANGERLIWIERFWRVSWSG